MNKKIIAVDSKNKYEWAKLCSLLWPHHSIEEFMSQDPSNNYLYNIDGQYVAIIQLSIRNDYVEGTESSPVGYLEGIYVLPDFRNAKIATELVDFAKDWSINHGCLELASDCEYENTVSRKFHNNIGFVEANTIICFTMKMLSLIKAAIDDSQEILNMQIEAFKPLLLKYQDYSTNPAAENIDRIKQRMSNPLITHFFIKLNKIKIGQISVYQINETTCRISQMFIMPQYQNKGYAQEAIRLIESEFANIKVWELDTIKQEPKLCHLYEKMNYVFTGETKHIKEGMDIIFYRK